MALFYRRRHLKDQSFSAIHRFEYRIRAGTRRPARTAQRVGGLLRGLDAVECDPTSHRTTRCCCLLLCGNEGVPVGSRGDCMGIDARADVGSPAVGGASGDDGSRIRIRRGRDALRMTLCPINAPSPTGTPRQRCTLTRQLLAPAAALARLLQPTVEQSLMALSAMSRSRFALYAPSLLASRGRARRRHSCMCRSFRRRTRSREIKVRVPGDKHGHRESLSDELAARLSHLQPTTRIVQKHTDRVG